MLPAWQTLAVYPYLGLEHPIRLAHRGSRILWPENTKTAFQGAVDLGYRYIETDVRMTRDGVVVIIHDKTVERTTDGWGRVADMDWSDVAKLDAGHTHDPASGFPFRAAGVDVPRLDDVLTTWPDVHFNIDLKAPGIEWAVAEVVKNLRRSQSVLIGSFNDRRIAKFRRITRNTVATSAGPRAAVALFAASRLGRVPKQAPAAYQLPFDSRAGRIDDRLVATAHAAGAQVHVWTVNDAADMGRMLATGVDGIVTDRPDTLNEVLGVAP